MTMADLARHEPTSGLTRLSEKLVEEKSRNDRFDDECKVATEQKNAVYRAM